jgi:sulfur relay (sulfurtransferase) DsrF/TusC family protein
MKALQIIETGYRATLEEQDDTIVWLTHAMKGAGADLDVLIRGNGVAMAVKGQDPSGLKFGAREQKHAPRVADDIAGLVGKGVTVMIVEEDCAERGIKPEDLVGQLQSVSRADIPRIFDRYDQVWHW